MKKYDPHPLTGMNSRTRPRGELQGTGSTIVAARLLGVFLVGVSACRDPDGPDQTPVARFSVEPAERYAQHELRFDASGSHDPDGSVERYVWDFGAGSTWVLSTTTTTYAYDSEGAYTACLTVEDDRGATDRSCLDLIVERPERIAFWSNMDEETGEIYRADLIDDSLVNSVRLTVNDGVGPVWPPDDAGPAWSPDGRSLVWSATRTQSAWSALYVMDPDDTDGADGRRLTPPVDGFSAYFPAWCNDGRIYFNYRDRAAGTQGIARINEDGTGLRKVVEEPFRDLLSGRPACSPDGSRIAYVSVDGDPDIHVANADDGGDRRSLTNSLVEEWQPVWSPDGEGIYFGRGEVFYYDLGAGTIAQVTFGRRAVDPALSPDGEKLLFVGQITGWYDLYMKNLGTGEVIQLTFSETEGGAGYRYPAWRPSPEE